MIQERVALTHVTTIRGAPNCCKGFAVIEILYDILIHFRTMVSLCSEKDQGPVAFNIIGNRKEFHRQHIVWCST